LELDRSRVSNLPGRLGFTDHDGEKDGRVSTLEGDVLLDLKTELFIVRIVSQGTRLQVNRAILSVSLKISS
jgi:hypothetical protein